MVEVATETGRLRLRTWTAQDRVDFVHYMNTPVVMRWLGGLQDQAAYDTFFERIDALQHEFGHTFWVVERKADGELLGFCGLKRVNAPDAGAMTGDFEIGWRLREDSWGQGFAKEAATASLDLAFGRFGAPHVVALTVPGNESSWRLMERLGMTRRADLDFIDRRYGPELNPCIVYRIEAVDWTAARAAAPA